jgi:hypothetical protein
VNMSKKVQAAQIIEALGERLPFVKTAFTIRTNIFADAKDTMGYWRDLKEWISKIELARPGSFSKNVLAKIEEFSQRFDQEILIMTRRFDMVPEEKVKIIDGLTFFVSEIRKLPGFYSSEPRAMRTLSDLLESLDDLRKDVLDYQEKQKKEEPPAPMIGDEGFFAGPVATTDTKNTSEPASVEIPSAQTELLAEYKKVDTQIEESLSLLGDRADVSDAEKEKLVDTYAKMPITKQFFNYLETLSTSKEVINEKRLANMRKHLILMPSLITGIDAAIEAMAGE